MNVQKTIIVAAILLITYAANIYLDKSADMNISKPLSEFPMSFGNWQGKGERFEDWVYKMTGVDDSVLCNYTDGSGNNVQLYIGYYKNQKEGKIIHSPRNCMAGKGWNITGTSEIELLIKSPKPKKVKVRLLNLQNGLKQQIVLYWYYSRGRVITSEYQQKLYLVVDSITRKRSDGSFVRLISPVFESENQTLDLIKSFAVEIFPIIVEHIPS